MKNCYSQQIYSSFACIVLLLFTVSCTAPMGFDMEQLLLGPEDLPGEWAVVPGSPSPITADAPLAGGFPAIESMMIVFSHSTDDGSAGAFEKIYRFRRESESTEAYREIKESSFRNVEDLNWVRPNWDMHIPIHATEATLLCNTGRIQETCQLVARYGTYVVHLLVDLDGLNTALEPIHVISHEDFLNIIESLEEKMRMIE